MSLPPRPATAPLLLPWPRHMQAAAQSPPAATARPLDEAPIRYTSGADARVHHRLQTLLPDGLDRPLQIDVGQIETGYPELDADEGYRLDFTADEIVLSAATTWGALHGVVTLWQLHSLRCVPHQGSIDDAPRFTWRGLLIDVARHFIPLEQLKRIADGMARLKMNVLHLHLTDDQGFRLDLRAYPELASEDSYSAAQIQELVAYAADLGVRVVPEIDVPGHVHSWLVEHPEWGQAVDGPTTRFGVHEASLDVTSDVVYGALQTILAEVAELFPDTYLHIGGDEVHPAWWRASPSIQDYQRRHGLADAQALQAHFNQRLCGFLSSLDKRPVAWDEALHDDMPQLTVQNWRGATTRDRALTAGCDCIVSAGYYLDLFYPAAVHYQWDPTAPQAVLLQAEDGLRNDLRFAHIAGGLAWTDQWRRGAVELATDAPVTGRVLGGEACLWSELVDAHTLDVRLWTRLPAVAERLWSPASITDEQAFYARLDAVQDLPGLAVSATQRERLLRLGLDERQLALAAYLEPVKWYARLLGAEALQARLRGSEMPQARPYQVHTPLNRVVDFIAPESLAARKLAQASPAALMALAEQWRTAAAADWPEDTRAVIAALADLGQRLEILQHGPGALQADALEDFHQGIAALYRPYGEYMLAPVPWLLTWLQQWYRGER